MRGRSRIRSSLMRVYAQQQRFDRLRSLRVGARVLTILALVVLVATTAILDQVPPRTLALRALLGVGLSIWLVAFALDYLVHSNRLNSRRIMMRLLSARTAIDEIEWRRPPDVSPRAASWVPMTAERIEKLHAEASRLEAALKQSERKVEGALLASTTAALAGTLTIILGVAFSLPFPQ